MTELETKLSHVEWCYRANIWTTVRDGVGFALYRWGKKMWLAGYSKEVVGRRQEIHKDEAPYLTTYGEPWKDSMFNIPTSDDFISAIVLKHYPEILS